MTKYFMAFAFLLFVTIGNTYFFSKKDSRSETNLVQQEAEQGVQQVHKEKKQQEPARIARVTSWKETEYRHYSPSRREHLKAEQQPKPAEKLAALEAVKKPAAKKRKPDTIEYVKVPFKGSYILVSRDYYTVGGVRTPLTRKQAEQVARQHGAVLPTKEMVDAIWQHADLKLNPQPLQAGPLMTQKVYFNKHDDMIDRQIGNRPFRLVAGHKKDIIRSQRKGRVTIYGWQRQNGKAIQPVSSVHDDKYVDYSNCLRLVKLPS